MISSRAMLTDIMAVLRSAPSSGKRSRSYGLWGTMDWSIHSRNRRRITGEECSEPRPDHLGIFGIWRRPGNRKTCSSRWRWHQAVLMTRFSSWNEKPAYRVFSYLYVRFSEWSHQTVYELSYQLYRMRRFSRRSSCGRALESLLCRSVYIIV